MSTNTLSTLLKQKKHDFDKKTFMGKSGNFDGNDIIDIVLDQKQCARFICTKVYTYFVNPTVDENHLEEITELFYKDYDIKKLMHYIFSSNWFYESQNIGVKIKSPIELLVGIQQIVPVEFLRNKQLLYLQKMMGQVLLDPPNVAGWKGNTNWIDSNTLMFRLKLPSLLLNNGVINLDEKGTLEDTFNDYYKSQNKQKRYLRTTISWDVFNKEYATTSPSVLKNILINTQIDRDTEVLLSNLKIEDNKDYVIQLMSLPEYQLC